MRLEIKSNDEGAKYGMVEIIDSNAPDTIKIVSFCRTIFSGRKIKVFIEALESPFEDEDNSILIPGINLTLDDIPEFLEAVQLAAKIASDEMEKTNQINKVECNTCQGKGYNFNGPGDYTSNCEDCDGLGYLNEREVK